MLNIFYFFVGCLLCSSLACVARPRTVLSITLWDTFGDGWGEARLLVKYPSGETSVHRPACETRSSIVVDPCASSVVDGGYVLSIQAINESTALAYWEIFWRVEQYDPYGSSTGDHVDGSIDTVMVWTYDSWSDSWTMHAATDLLDPECIACTGQSCASSGCNDGADLKVSMYPTYEELATALPFGALWSVSSADSSQRLHHGSICSDIVPNGKKHHECYICLRDGSYIYRSSASVLGALNTTASAGAMPGWGLSHQRRLPACYGTDCPIEPKQPRVWKFCDVKGDFGSHLTFHIKNGRCIPDLLLLNNDVCEEVFNSTVAVHGVLVLSGYRTDYFNSADGNIILGALGDTVNGWLNAGMSVLDAELFEEPTSDILTHNVSFRVIFTAEDCGVDGSIYSSVESLVNSMKQEIDMSTSSGEYVHRLVGLAAEAGAANLAEISGANLLSLNIVSIKYSHNRLEIKPKKAKKEKKKTFDKVLARSVLATAVGVAAVSYFVASAIAANRTRESHDMLPTDSSYGAGDNDLLEMTMNPIRITPSMMEWETETDDARDNM